MHQTLYNIQLLHSGLKYSQNYYPEVPWRSRALLHKAEGTEGYRLTILQTGMK